MNQEERIQEEAEEIPAPKYKRISEVAGKGALEGEPISIDEILGEEVLITGFAYRPSQFEGREHYLAIQIMRGGKKYVFTTGSQVILDTFENISLDQLPLLGVFERVKGAKGRRYYQVV